MLLSNRDLLIGYFYYAGLMIFYVMKNLENSLGFCAVGQKRSATLQNLAYPPATFEGGRNILSVNKGVFILKG